MSGDRDVLVFGLDGVTFDLIGDWIDQGELPYFEKLIQEGVQGDLTSTLPPVTGPAWSSFQTGLRPGKHGVFDWGNAGEEAPGKGIVDSTHIQSDTLWELLSQGGKEVGVIGLPVTYPPREVNGFILTGLLTPQNAEDYVYPQGLEDEIQEVVDNYVTAPLHAEMAVNKQAWVEELENSIENREKVSTHLLSQESWDVSMVYFMETDTVMHHLYHTVRDDGKGPSDDKFDENPVLRIHKRVEQAVKRIVDAVAEPDTDVILVSDHGFGQLDWIFNVNTWLMEQGYLSLKNDPSTRLKRTALNLGLNQKNLYYLGDLLGPLGKSKKWDMQGFEDILGKIFLSMDDVDWRNTKAFSRGGVLGEIGLNVKGQGPPGGINPEGIEKLKEELTSDLKNVRNPSTGKPVVEEVIDSEEAYDGPQADIGPDLLFKTRDMRTDTGGLTVFKSAKPIIESFATTGTHRMNGIFMASGPEFQEERSVEGLHITDVAPTILHLADLPIPEYMDGTVEEEILAPSFKAGNPLRYRDLNLPDGNGNKEDPEAKSDKENEEIKERLKGLGYLD